uniref:Uncharacterized protein n=1 Tax=Conchiformibius kuhniae TaxID=211502 RepID=A0A8T9MUV7_9NEIS|nr:hypothetical protein LVJ77_01770 [Conchiformibius kuhniae]
MIDSDCGTLPQGKAVFCHFSGGLGIAAPCAGTGAAAAIQCVFGFAVPVCWCTGRCLKEC